MKFTCSTEIDRPIANVVKLFMNKANYKHWKKDFIGYENISGTEGEVGSVTKLFFKRITLVETITFKNLPHEIREEYENKHGNNTLMIHTAINRFLALSDNRTRYTTEIEMTKIFGFLMKIMLPLMAGAGKKQAQEQLAMFKTFVENR
jgi:hypothetical protein